MVGARRHATVLTTPGVGAVAICLPPAHVFSAESMNAAGMADAPTRLGPEELVLLGRLNTALGALHHDVMREPHWQLSFLGTDPDRQGRGHGGALVDALGALADTERVPTYLDTLDAGNVTFYYNHGYTTVTELDLPGSDVHLWAMQNHPGALPVRPAG